jgi:tetratricopeptide (TPR) repeat protein
MSERASIPTPYKGLAPYSEEDAPFFFGREADRRIIASNLMAMRLTVLYGAAGVGKSSVLRAGVLHDLRQIGRKNFNDIGKPKLCAAVFSGWHDDPMPGLVGCVQESVAQALRDRAIEREQPAGSPAETFQRWANLVGGDLLIILDQFEDYLLSHEHDNGLDKFACEFPRLVNSPELRVNFLISIRDDLYSRLDCFENDIPDLFENFLRLGHLDRKAARAAIEKPIDRYNKFYGVGGRRMAIDPDLVDEVLNRPELHSGVERRYFEKSAGGESFGPAGEEETFEAPVLQLVMSKLWEEETRSGSNKLRLQTLERLKGIQTIVETHLTGILGELSRKERALAGRAFHYLVTPSAHKVAWSASDLAASARLNYRHLMVLLEKLSKGSARILRSIAPTVPGGEPLYEIFHDILCRPILQWRTRAEERARFAARIRLLTVAVILIFLVAVAVGLYARKESARRHAVEAGNVSSQVLSKLYLVLTGDPKTAGPKMEAALDTLNQAVDMYQKNGMPVGEGIALNNIAGIYRAAGESSAGLEKHEEAQGYYRQAEGYDWQALGLLEKELGPEHTEVATSLTDLSVLFSAEGRYGEAQPLLLRALRILEGALQPDDSSLADAVMNVAECYNSQGKYALAEPLYKRALDIRKKKLPGDDSNLAESYYGLARLYFEQGRLNEAEPLFNQALTVWQSGSEPERQDSALNQLAAIYRKRLKFAEAEQYLQRARDAHDQSIDQNHLLLAFDFENLALLYDDQDKAAADAESYFKDAVKIMENAFGSDHPVTAYYLSNLAAFYSKHGRDAEAEPIFKRALEVQKNLPDSPELARTLRDLAQLYTRQANYAEAEPLFQQALAIQEKAIPDHPDRADTMKDYADLLRKTGRDAEASQMDQRDAQILDKHKKENPDT